MPGLDISQLVATTGAYFRDMDNRNLFWDMFGAMEFIGKHITVEDGNPDELAKGQIKFKKVLKPRQATWTPTTTPAEVKARIVKVRQAEVSIDIDNIRDLHKNFLAKFKRPGAQANNLPFESELMDGFVEQAKEDLAVDALFRGVHDSGGTDPVDVFDGYNKIIADEITALNLTPIVTGALTSSNTVEKLDLVLNGVSEKWRYKKLKMFVSPQISRWYFSNYKTLNSGNAPNQKDVIRELMNGKTLAEKAMYLDNSECEIVPAEGLAGSQRVIVCPQKNIILSHDSLADLETLTVEYMKRVFSIYMDMSVGVGFHTLDALWVNDQV